MSRIGALRATAVLVVLILLLALTAVALGFPVSDLRDDEYTVIVEPRADANWTTDDIVSFEDLSSDQQRVFERALESPDRDARTDDDRWTGIDAVRYENETYEITVGVYN